MTAQYFNQMFNTDEDETWQSLQVKLYTENSKRLIDFSLIFQLNNRVGWRNYQQSTFNNTAGSNEADFRQK